MLQLLIALLVINTSVLADSARVSDISTVSRFVNITKDVVNTYDAPNANAMGLDYDSTNGWLWHVTENDIGSVYTIDPSNGSATHRFDISTVVGCSSLHGNGVYLNEVSNLLYVADHNGNLDEYDDVVYCFDVSDPDNPTLEDAWDIGDSILWGILGITYREPYFYVTSWYGPLYVFTFTIGGGHTEIATYWSTFNMGGIWYDTNEDVFYTHRFNQYTVFTFDGADPSIYLGQSDPGCRLVVGMSDDPSGLYFWTSNYHDQELYQFEITYWEAIESASLGEIKAFFK